MLQDHYEPKTSSIVQRFKFNCQVRVASDFISTYVAGLRELSEHCDYKDSVKQMLRDRWECGVNHEPIQHRLLSVKELICEMALDIAIMMEDAEKTTTTS